MNPSNLRAAVKAATNAAGAEADAILHASDRAEALAEAALEMLATGDRATAVKLAKRAAEISAWFVPFANEVAP